MNTTENKKPVDTLRDGSIKATIWRNEGEKGAFFSVTIRRTYKTDDGFQDSDSFSGTELLQASLLFKRAYERSRELRQAEKTEAQENGASE